MIWSVCFTYALTLVPLIICFYSRRDTDSQVNFCSSETTRIIRLDQPSARNLKPNISGKIPDYNHQSMDGFDTCWDCFMKVVHNWKTRFSG